MIPVRDYIRQNRLSANEGALEKVQAHGVQLRPLRNSDFALGEAEMNANNGIVSAEALD